MTTSGKASRSFHPTITPVIGEPGFEGGITWRRTSPEARYPENDPVNNAMAIVENRLLVAALGGDRSAPARFLVVRLHRQSRVDPELVAYETGQEFNEGTPTYVEIKAGKPDTDLTSALAQCNIGGKWAAYRRFYFADGGIALLLDGLMRGWSTG